MRAGARFGNVRESGDELGVKREKELQLAESKKLRSGGYLTSFALVMKFLEFSIEARRNLICNSITPEFL